ncbi:PilZ domain-containing protein [Tropicimonas sp. TH_r6]|uniref:PilZ domain-containing protein n=1 Tax=Tropicimonas sp. TH_r6 TaxID=3082085 RepID=UPI002954527F|nr:PilZ domain-containing protein [Tropicimonas sp. TH_r6]MDV7145509.1 PilZ domain-containing protein [Tropicimonas sp. TH_r6]
MPILIFLGALLSCLWGATFASAETENTSMLCQFMEQIGQTEMVVIDLAARPNTEETRIAAREEVRRLNRKFRYLKEWYAGESAKADTYVHTRKQLLDAYSTGGTAAMLQAYHGENARRAFSFFSGNMKSSGCTSGFDKLKKIEGSAGKAPRERQKWFEGRVLGIHALLFLGLIVAAGATVLGLGMRWESNYQRAHKRFYVDLEASLSTYGARIPCRVLDISVGGAKIRPRAPVILAQNAEIALRWDENWHDGVVTWSTDEGMGVRFAKHIAVKEILQLTDHAPG